MYNYTKYVVVCENERQAKLLFEDILTYWSIDSRPRRGLRGQLRINRKMKVISDPMTAVMVVSERKMCDLASEFPHLKCRLINGTSASRWLDAKRKERIEKEKENG